MANLTILLNKLKEEYPEVADRGKEFERDASVDSLKFPNVRCEGVFVSELLVA